MSHIQWFESQAAMPDKWHVIAWLADQIAAADAHVAELLVGQLTLEEVHQKTLRHHDLVIIAAFAENVTLPHTIACQLKTPVIWHNHPVSFLVVLVFPSNYDRVEAEISKLGVAHLFHEVDHPNDDTLTARREAIDQVLAD